MRAWQASLEGAAPVVSSQRLTGNKDLTSHPGGWQRPPANDDQERAIHDAAKDHDTETMNAPLHQGMRQDIVPRRPGGTRVAPNEGFGASHLFWKGIVVGAVVVLVIKTILAVRAPYGVDWYGF